MNIFIKTILLNYYQNICFVKKKLQPSNKKNASVNKPYIIDIKAIDLLILFKILNHLRISQPH